MKQLFPFLSSGLLAAVTLLYAPQQAESCGPEFPNHILGTARWKSAPYADFEGQLISLGLVPARPAEQPMGEGAHSTFTADVDDLQAALAGKGETHAPLERAYRIIRLEVEKVGTGSYRSSALEEDGMEARISDLEGEIEALSQDGLPLEFKLYLLGALRYRAMKHQEACKTWEQLLALLPGERTYKSTWAAYMLGKTLIESDPDKAWKHFETTRNLAAAGFKDSLNLSNEAEGWKGYIALARKDYGPAIDCYLNQRGFGSSIESLQVTASRALFDCGPNELKSLAANPKWRGVITSFLVSRKAQFSEVPAMDRLSRWQAALEAAEVKNAELAEKFALAAYQNGNMEDARKWVELSASSPVSQWLMAKLALYDGDLQRAADILVPLSKTFPVEPESGTAPGEFGATLGLENNFHYHSAAQQIWAERGVVELSRKNYVQALDAFMQAGFWLDAAYVAERVLTVAELKKYVDDHSTRLMKLPDSKAIQLRDLLARRLTRSNQAAAAGPYYAVVTQPFHAQLVEQLRKGYDNALQREERALALFEAAKITREHGLELMGTELAPDWAESGGGFDWGDFFEIRNEGEDTFLVSSEEEKSRVLDSEMPFSRRFHYRYVAAELAWIAAGFMPNHHVETARMLCLGGSWLKYRDPEYADRFYKALVNRCRKTDLGAQADALRWFPKVDKGGNLIVPKEEPELQFQQGSDEEPGNNLGSVEILSNSSTEESIAIIE